MIPSWEQFAVYLFIERKLDRSNESSYKSRFTAIRDFFVKKPFDKDNINYFFSTLESRNLSNETLNGYLKIIKHLCRFQGLDFMRDYTYWKKVRPTYRILTDSEVKQLVKCFLPRGFGCDSEMINNRFSVAIHFMAVCGTRVGEMLSLTWENVMPDRVVVTSKNSKTNTERQIPISEETYRLINTLEKHDNNYVFGDYRGAMDIKTFNLEIKERAKFLRFKDWHLIHSHQFRHYFCVSALKAGLPIQLVARCMGDTIQTVDHYYSHYIIEDLRQVIESLPLNASHMSFNLIKDKVKKLADQVGSTPHYLHLSEKENMIILEVQNGQH